MTLAPFTPCPCCVTPDTCGRAGECRPACPGCKTPHWCAGMGCAKAKAKASNFATKRDGEPVPGAGERMIAAANEALGIAQAATLPPRAAVLREAERLICGDRQDAYGPPAESFARVAALWSAYLGHPVAPHQVAVCMALLKVGRMAYAPGAPDNPTDGCGYLALAAELAAEMPASGALTASQADMSGRG